MGKRAYHGPNIGELLTSSLGFNRYPNANRKDHRHIAGTSINKKKTPTRNFLTFVNATAIAYGRKIDQGLKILVACNSSRFYKRQKIASIPPHGILDT